MGYHLKALEHLTKRRRYVVWVRAETAAQKPAGAGVSLKKSRCFHAGFCVVGVIPMLRPGRSLYRAAHPARGVGRSISADLVGYLFSFFFFFFLFPSLFSFSLFLFSLFLVFLLQHF
jgi:hypothetical protein